MSHRFNSTCQFRIGFADPKESRQEPKCSPARFASSRRRRLVSSNETIEDIAERCRFTKLYRLNEAFKCKYGATPKDYHQSHREDALA